MYDLPHSFQLEYREVVGPQSPTRSRRRLRLTGLSSSSLGCTVGHSIHPGCSGSALLRLWHSPSSVVTHCFVFVTFPARGSTDPVHRIRKTRPPPPHAGHVHARRPTRERSPRRGGNAHGRRGPEGPAPTNRARGMASSAAGPPKMTASSPPAAGELLIDEATKQRNIQSERERLALHIVH